MVPITIDMIWSLMFQEGLSDKFLWVGVRIVTHVLSISICHENRVFAAILFDELRPELARTDRQTGPGHWRHNEWTLRSTRCSRHIIILHSPWGPIKVVLRVKLEEKLSFNYNCVTPWWGGFRPERGWLGRGILQLVLLLHFNKIICAKEFIWRVFFSKFRFKSIFAS